MNAELTAEERAIVDNAKRAFPSLPELEATIAYVLAHAREAVARIEHKPAMRSAPFRENRDK